MIRTESNSSVNTYKTCPAKYRHHYGPNKRYIKTTEAMQLGNIVHESFAHSLAGNATTKEALDYAATAFTYADVQEKGKAVIEYYAPLIGFNGAIKALTGMIEYKFNVEIEGVRVLGYIDAILIDQHGNNVLVDWKTRGQLLDSRQVAMDSQLYVYAYVAQHVLGLQIDRVCQVQMRTTLPAKPKILKRKAPKKTYKPKEGASVVDRQNEIMSECPDSDMRYHDVVMTEAPLVLSKTLGKTTEAFFKSSLVAQGYEWSVESAAIPYRDRFVDESEFLRMSYIDMNKVTAKTNEFIGWIKRIQEDNQMLPVNNGPVCKWCQYTDLCLGG